MWRLIAVALASAPLALAVAQEDRQSATKPVQYDRATFRLDTKDGDPATDRLKRLAKALRELPEVFDAAAIEGKPEIRVDFDFTLWQEEDVVKRVRRLEKRATLAGPIARVAQNDHIGVVITPDRHRFSPGKRASFQVAYRPRGDTKVRAALLLCRKLNPVEHGEEIHEVKELEQADSASVTTFEIGCPTLEMVEAIKKGRENLLLTWKTLETSFIVKYVLALENGSTEVKYLRAKIRVPLEGIDSPASEK